MMDPALKKPPPSLTLDSWSPHHHQRGFVNMKYESNINQTVPFIVRDRHASVNPLLWKSRPPNHEGKSTRPSCKHGKLSMFPDGSAAYAVDEIPDHMG